MITTILTGSYQIQSTGHNVTVKLVEDANAWPEQRLSVTVQGRVRRLFDEDQRHEARAYFALIVHTKNDPYNGATND